MVTAFMGFVKHPEVIQKKEDLVSLVTSWGSSNNHNNFSPISSPSGGGLYPTGQNISPCGEIKTLT